MLVDVSATDLYPDEFLRLLAERGVLGLERDTSRIRFVTHRLIGDDEIAAPPRSRGRGERPQTRADVSVRRRREATPRSRKYDLQRTVSETSLARV